MAQLRRVLAFCAGTLRLCRSRSTTPASGSDGGDRAGDITWSTSSTTGDGVVWRRRAVANGDRCASFSHGRTICGLRLPSTAVAITVLASHEFFHAASGRYCGSMGWWTGVRRRPGPRQFRAAPGGTSRTSPRRLPGRNGPLAQRTPISSVDAFSYGLAISADSWANHDIDRIITRNLKPLRTAPGGGGPRTNRHRRGSARRLRHQLRRAFAGVT